MSSPSKAIHDKLVEVLQNVDTIKTVYSGIIPPVSEVKVFPSIAIDYANKMRKEGIVINTMSTTEEIDLFVYNQQKANKFEDIMSELCASIDKAIQQDTTLRELCISCYVSEILSDGGVMHSMGGRCIYRLTVTCKYLEKCDGF